MTIYWPRDKRVWAISSHLDQTNLLNKGFIIWHSTPSCRFAFLLLCLLVFVAKCILKTHQNFCSLCFHFRWCFQFSRFLVPSWERNHRKSFTVSEFFVKENCTLAKFTAEQNGQSWADSIAPSYPLG